MRGMVMVECPRRCGWVEPVGSLFALGPTLTAARSAELVEAHADDCPLVDEVETVWMLDGTRLDLLRPRGCAFHAHSLSGECLS